MIGDGSWVTSAGMDDNSLSFDGGGAAGGAALRAAVERWTAPRTCGRPGTSAGAAARAAQLVHHARLVAAVDLAATARRQVIAELFIMVEPPEGGLRQQHVCGAAAAQGFEVGDRAGRIG